MITDRSQCWHDRATTTIGPTTTQRTRYCPDCGLSTTDWPDDLQQARERVAAAGGPSLGELRERLSGAPDASGTVATINTTKENQ